MLKEEIIAYSRTLGIDMIGFCSADPFIELGQVLKERQAKGYAVSFEEQDIQKRIDPQRTLKGAKTFIVIGESYQVEEDKGEKPPLTAQVSIGALGKDYHLTVMEKLAALEQYILTLAPCQIKKFVDIAPFSDRQVAHRAGIGFYGRNTMLIHPKYGSRFHIGYLLTDLELQPDQPIQMKGCDSCHSCEKNCPTGAIQGDGTFNANLCIGYLTQHKGAISQGLKEKMGTALYGCDICQKGCPYNQRLPHNQIIARLLPHHFPLQEVLTFSNRAFKEKFGKTSAGWRGKKWIQRNAIINLGNIGTDQALSLLEACITDPRREIREEVIWAISQIKSQKSRDLLKKMATIETDVNLKEMLLEVLGEYL